MGGPEFAMAAWGSPSFPGGGQWSFLRRAAPGDAPQPLDRDQGVPLVRAGASTAPPPHTSPYRFADPEDTLRPDNPAADYGIVHATGTQRLFFPRPKIEATGTPAITSARPPLLADPYLLSTAVGLFPRAENCIPFPDAKYALAIGPGGNFRLQLPTPSFTVPPLDRALLDSPSVRSIVHYADENGNRSEVTLKIDTAAPVPWAISISNLSLALESGALGELHRLVGTLRADANIATTLERPRLVFGPPLKPVQGLISFLEKFSFVPPVDVALTNHWSLQVGVQADFEKALQEYAPEIKAFLKQFLDELNLVVSLKASGTSLVAVLEFEVVVKFPLPIFPQLIGVGLGKIQVVLGNPPALGDRGDPSFQSFALQIGYGGGIAVNLGFGELVAYAAQTLFGIVGTGFYGVGVSRLLKGKIDLNYVEVELSVEGKGILFRVSCNGGAKSTIWAVGQLTIAIEITIAWAIDIQIEKQIEVDVNLDRGPCPLPDTIP